MDWKQLPRFAFGDTQNLNDELLQSTLMGEKTATCWPGSVANVGAQYVILDSAQKPSAIIEITQVDRIRFCDVDARHAFDEGGADRTLEGWRNLHREWLMRLGQFDPHIVLNCIQFKLLKSLSQN